VTPGTPRQSLARAAASSPCWPTGCARRA